jgi:hypothetical protein
LRSPKDFPGVPVVEALDMNYNLDNERSFHRLNRSLMLLPRDRYIAANCHSEIPTQFQQHLIDGTVKGLRKLLKKERRYRKSPLNLEVVSSLQVQDTTKQIFFNVLSEMDIPPGIDITNIVETLDVAQQIMSSHPEEFFESRQDARRLYPGTQKRSHPAKPMGIYLEDDPGSIILLDAGLPVNSGTSGTTSNVVNGYFNLFGGRLPKECRLLMAKAVHGYLAGPLVIDILTSKIEEGVKKRVSEDQPDMLGLLRLTGLGQSHTLGECINACLLTDTAQQEGGQLSKEKEAKVLKEGAEITAEIMDEK